MTGMTARLALALSFLSVLGEAASMPLPVPAGEGAILENRGEAAGHTIYCLNGPDVFRRTTGLAVLERKILIGTRTGLFAWDLNTSAVTRVELFGTDSAPVANVLGSGGPVLIATEAMGTVLWQNSCRQVLLAGAGEHEDEASSPMEKPVSGTLRELYCEGSLLLGLWEKEGAAESFDSGRTWNPLALRDAFPSASPTCLAVGSAGSLACGMKAADRSFLALSTDRGREWTAVPEFRSPIRCIAFVGPASVLAGLASGGATLVDLKEGRSSPVAALADCGRIFQLSVREDKRIACATEKGLVFLSGSLAKAAELRRRDGLPGDCVRAFSELPAFGKGALVLACEPPRGRTGGGLAVIVKRPARKDP